MLPKMAKEAASYIRSQRGGKLLIINNYIFRTKGTRSEASNKIYWMCNTPKCNARAVVIDDKVGRISGSHSHEDDKLAIEAKMFSEKLKERAFKEQGSIPSIYKEELAAATEAFEDTSHLPAMCAAQYKMNRARHVRSNRRTAHKRSAAVDFVIDHRKKDHPFALQGDSTEDQDADNLKSSGNHLIVTSEPKNLNDENSPQSLVEADKRSLAPYQKQEIIKVQTTEPKIHKWEIATAPKPEAKGGEKTLCPIQIEEIIKVERSESNIEEQEMVSAHKPETKAEERLLSPIQVQDIIGLSEPDMQEQKMICAEIKQEKIPLSPIQIQEINKVAPSEPVIQEHEMVSGQKPESTEETNPLSPIQIQDFIKVELSEPEIQEMASTQKSEIYRVIRDDCDMYAEHVAFQLRQLDDYTRAVAQYRIDCILFEAKRRSYNPLIAMAASVAHYTHNTVAPIRNATFFM